MSVSLVDSDYYREVFQHSPCSAILLNRDLVVVDVNRAYLELTAIPDRKARTTLDLCELLPLAGQDEREAVRASLNHVLEQHTPDTVRNLYCCFEPKDETSTSGFYHPYDIAHVPIFDDDGNIAFILASITETSHTESRQVDKADAEPLARAEAEYMQKALGSPDRERQLQMLVDQAPGFVAILHGPNFRFSLANQAYYQLVGHRKIIGKPLLDAIPEIADQGFVELLREVYHSGTRYVGKAVPVTLQKEVGGTPSHRYVDFILQSIVENDGSVSGVFIQGHDVTETHRLAEELRYQATHDSVTGLCNRREFERKLGETIEQLSAEGTPHALLYLDLDQFKLVNDTSGHYAGDQLLKLIADTLPSHLQPQDLIARLGGDEFGILLWNRSERDALATAETLRQAIKEIEFVWEGRVFGGSVSVGLVTLTDSSLPLREAMSAADSACFLAKEKGRNRVQLYRFGDDEVVTRWREMDWVGRLREALKDERLELHAQKIEPLSGAPETCERYETLVRLRAAGGELVPPMAFIPAAERYGLMPSIDRYVIRKGFEFIAETNRHSETNLVLSINLSGATLNDEGLSEFVIAEARRAGIDPQQVCFEVTETVAVTDIVTTARVMRTFKDNGYRFALDDFGSGMSSFGYLRNLPIDYLKIDGTFIQHIVSDKVDAAMVEAIADVAKVMGIETVAEYVEGDTTRQHLLKIGVVFGQGYGIHKPLPISQLAL
ncbi:hypothetical protein CAI21_09480 [Alkalilimnicola ehrlichii]|uniref:EAL domain-containing protein n=1 Tax=Alkalilimnicola ehrlichii TaxID=351052 RepID=A0A3E0WV07_9GAMM|nr:EAL domain-containing protein [Alkalilimnicola ehrlichii]RFA29301.1 hypothetical protein CAI21_09480 [Alkalilimnicola ehrlichii]RFA36814.1 hypothetical protein CAL65_09815 [Alkalilimnicola ehrlichii]